MIAWRISKRKYSSPAIVLGGEGAKKYGGRWNEPGLALVYASENSSLAILETLANLGIDDLPKSLAVVRIDVPDDVVVDALSTRRLPSNWKDVDNPACARIGSTWVRAAVHLALRAPSAVNPLENNILLNPLHPAIRRCRVRRPIEVAFDSRLLSLVRA